MLSKKYTFSFSRNAEKNFSKLEKDIQRRIIKKLESIEESSNPFLFADKIQGSKELFRIRAGDYRIIFRPEKDGTLVLLVVLKVGE